MKNTLSLLCCALWLSACYTPAYYVKNGDYDKAVDVYLANAWREGFKNEKFVRTAETAYAKALEKDRNELKKLDSVQLKDKAVRSNAIYRRIQSREQRVFAAGPVKSRRGYKATFERSPDIDSLESESRREAAAYLYDKARELLRLADSSRRPEPAREAYFTLKTLTKDYFPKWENAEQLIDSAHRNGVTYWYIEPASLVDLSDSRTFWSAMRIDSNFIKNEWTYYIGDSSRFLEADYRVKCSLTSLYVGSESTSTEEKTESKQVEDGYDEVKDSTGHVVSRTTKYKTVTTTTYTYSASRSANGSLLIEIIDLHDGKTLMSKSLQGSHHYSATSDIVMPTSPSYWGMIDYVADDLKWQLRRELKKVLLPKPL